MLYFILIVVCFIAVLVCEDKHIYYKNKAADLFFRHDEDGIAKYEQCEKKARQYDNIVIIILILTVLGMMIVSTLKEVS